MRIPREPKATRLHEYTKERTKRKLKCHSRCIQTHSSHRVKKRTAWHRQRQQSWFSTQSPAPAKHFPYYSTTVMVQHFRGLYGNKRTMKHIVDDHPLQHRSSATTAGSKAGKTASTASVAGTHYIFNLSASQKTESTPQPQIQQHTHSRACHIPAS
ncbi:hypothetical protein Nepgr_014699 [Nepenthes gracilis]|uniref:Uncharacterized protein n=1 Tax=Nepenthes gracilis TaxID=150966 RepID=A0AAD3SJZ7_NEPGR|nr:hypothetical protein Nepgr_014699 [Nepenthes gracilis]